VCVSAGASDGGSATQQGDLAHNITISRLMSHSPNKNFHSYRPGRSTVLDETKRIVYPRVPESTKERIAEENRVIEATKQRLYIESKKRFKEEDYRRIKERADDLEAMANRWRAKTAKSPFATDYKQREEQRYADQMAMEQFIKMRRDQSAAMRAMIGTEKASVFSRDKIPVRVSEPAARLALEWKRSVVDEKITRKEHMILGSMVEEECSRICEYLPGMVDAYGPQLRAMSASMTSRTTMGSRASVGDRSSALGSR
jgi:hypothetical protein